MDRAQILTSVLCLVAVVTSCRPIDSDAARAEAERRFSKYITEFEVDRNAFEGPLEVEPPAGAQYGFEWRYSDSEGQVRFFVWVEASGSSHTAIEGEMERLKRRGGPPARG